MNPFSIFGNALTKAPIIAAVIMPLVSIIFMIVGFKDAEMELDIEKLWIPETTDYALGLNYFASVNPATSTTYDFIAISVPRAGGNAMTAPLLLELRDRLKAAQDITVTINGVTVGYEDMCQNPVAEYDFPCFRMHVLDCFLEGNYDWTEENSANWNAMVRPSFIAGAVTPAQRDGLIQQYMPEGWKSALPMIYDALVSSAMVQPPYIPSMNQFGCGSLTT